MANALREQIRNLIAPPVEAAGYELVDVEWTHEQGGWICRVLIDKAPTPGGDKGGVGLEDCEQVSREVSALFDVNDPIPTSYTLEVSSPGFDRVLRTQAHFGRFVGSRVLVELKAPRDGRRRYTGTLLSVDEAGFALEVDRQKVEVPFVELAKARLAPSVGDGK